MSASRQRLAAAVRTHARRHVSTQRVPHLGIVLNPRPLQIELEDRRLVLDEDDVIVSQWVRRYEYEHGLVPGDTVLVIHMPSDQFVVTDVVSKNKIESGLDEEHRAAAAFTSRNGAIVGTVPYLNEEGTVIGLVLLYDTPHSDPGGETLPVT